MNTSLSIFARALATENISFAFDPSAETASFDVKNRHLILPVWKVSETVQTMLIAHEISHALWTPYNESEAILAEAEKEGYNKNVLQRLANVVEDVRIEKMMKQKYPGTRRDFFLGYREIVENDLFGFKNMDMDSLNLATRLNMHFKWGVPGFMDIPMTDEQQRIAEIIDEVETFKEVYEVAKMLYKHPEMEEIVKKAEQEMEANGADGEKIADKIVDGDPGQGLGKHDGEKYTASSLVITGLKDYKKCIVDSDTLLAMYEENAVRCHDVLNMGEYREFVKDSDAFVRQLVMQFERRKAADEIRRERPKQTGMLNLDRLHQYRTHDDIFLSKIIKQEGKNHGIVFLLDFSGSMSSSLKDCFLQVLQLVWFCEKAQIPFEVFAYTDVNPMYRVPDSKRPVRPDSKWIESNRGEEARSCPNRMLYEDACLVNLASSRQDAAKRERLLAFLYGSYVTRNTNTCTPYCLHLHGTPTVEAVAVASEFMKEWVVANDIQIPTIMVVTDGSPNGIGVQDYNSTRLYYHGQDDGTLTVVNEVMDITYRVNWNENKDRDVSNTVIGTMLCALREKLNARCVGMFVGGNNFHENLFSGFCLSRREREMGYNDKEIRLKGWSAHPRFKAAKESYADGALLVHPDIYPGYDAYFLVKTPKIVKDEDAIVEEGNFTKVKNTFVKTMAKRSCSRVFLTRYVDIVAGQPLNKGVDALYGNLGKK